MTIIMHTHVRANTFLKVPNIVINTHWKSGISSLWSLVMIPATGLTAHGNSGCMQTQVVYTWASQKQLQLPPWRTACSTRVSRIRRDQQGARCMRQQRTHCPASAHLVLSFSREIMSLEIRGKWLVSGPSLTTPQWDRQLSLPRLKAVLVRDVYFIVTLWFNFHRYNTLGLFTSKKEIFLYEWLAWISFKPCRYVIVIL
jgi:hypothetical protein